MVIVDLGTGPPVVVIPGIQGRWEWMRPGIEALARRCRVVTFSLADERSNGGRFDAARGFDGYVDQVEDAMNEAGLDDAAICGVSYGGLIAAAFAARHPGRTRALVLASALPPSWTPDRRVAFYLRAPRILAPVFLVMSPVRMHREIAAASPALPQRLSFSLRNGWNVATHMFSPSRMARRVRMLEGIDLRSGLDGVRAPTLLVTGEPALDRVVPVSLTLEYRRLIPHAETSVVERTGHIGVITRPESWADAIAPFVHRTASEDETRRRVG